MEDSQLIELDEVTLEVLALLPTNFIDDLAKGTHLSKELFEAHGYSQATHDLFVTNKAFLRFVKIRELELEREGETHKAKALRFSDDVLLAMSRKLRDGDNKMGELTDMYKATTKVAGLEPRASAVAQVGNGFSLNIIMPGAVGYSQGPKKRGNVIEAPVVHVTLDNEAEYEFY